MTKLKAIFGLIFSHNYLLITIPKTGKTTQYYNVYIDKFEQLTNSMTDFAKSMLLKFIEIREEEHKQ